MNSAGTVQGEQHPGRAPVGGRQIDAQAADEAPESQAQVERDDPPGEHVTAARLGRPVEEHDVNGRLRGGGRSSRPCSRRCWVVCREHRRCDTHMA